MRGRFWGFWGIRIDRGYKAYKAYRVDRRTKRSKRTGSSMRFVLGQSFITKVDNHSRA